MRKLSVILLVLVMVLLMIPALPVAAASGSLNESFDYADGTKIDAKNGWRMSGNMTAADKAEVRDGKLHIFKAGGTPVLILTNTLDKPITADKALVSFKMTVVKDTGYDLCFPMIGATTGEHDATTQLQHLNGSLNALVSKNGQTTEMGLNKKMREGVEYTFGYQYDFKNHTYNLFIRDEDGEINIFKDLTYKVANVSDINRFVVWFGDASLEAASEGEYIIDDVFMNEETPKALEDFNNIFYPKYDVGMDDLADIKAKMQGGMVLSLGDSMAIAGNSREQIDPENPNVVPFVVEGRTLLPARFVAESLGAVVGWDDVTQKVTIKGTGVDIALTIGEKEYTVNGEKREFDVPAQTYNDRTMLPMRAIAEAMGKQVSWKETGRDAGLVGIGDVKDIFNTFDATLLSRTINSFSVFVGTDGDDKNPGTKDKPFKTLEGARNYLRGVKAGKGLPQGGITVHVLGGEYEMTDSFTLSPDDTGSEQTPITYRAYPGDTVTMTGANSLPGNQFKEVTNEKTLSRMPEGMAGKVYQIDLKALGITNYGKVTRISVWSLDTPDCAALIVDGAKQTLARWPNDGYALTGAVNNDPNTPSFQFVGSEIARWKDVKGAWVHGYWAWDWADDSMEVKEFNPQTSTITTMNNHPYGIVEGKRYYVMNLLEELDSPGEWYVDQNTGILYYYPIEQNLANSKIQFATLDKPMVSINNAKYINFLGIDFEATAAAVFNIAGSEHITVATAEISNIGGKIVNSMNSYYCNYLGLDVFETSKGGIYVSNSGDADTYAGAIDRQQLINGHNLVENCYFSRFNTVSKTYAPAISFTGLTVGNTAKNNVIHNGPHAGILYGGNDHLIQNNELYDLCKEAHDMGAVYSGRDWASRGTVFDNNILHDIHGERGGVHGLYFDDGISQSPITRNIFYNTSTPVFTNGGRDFTIDSNIVANCETSIWNINISNIDELHYTRLAALPYKEEPWKSKYPHLVNLLEDQPEIAKYNKVNRTITYNSGAISYPANAADTCDYSNNLTTDDASLFEDAANNVFRLVKDPGINGFKQIAYDEMGNYPGAYRMDLFRVRDFKLGVPANGAKNVVAYNTKLRWNTAQGATYYNVTVATDKDLSNVIFSGRADDNSIIVDVLEYGSKTYYWQVEAVATSAFNKQTKQSDIYSFTTAQDEIVDTAALSMEIESANNMLQNASIGDGKGQQPKEAADQFASAIKEAETMVTEAVTQAECDSQVVALRAAKDAFKAAMNVGNVDLGTLIRQGGNWVAGNANYIRFPKQGTMTFTPELDSAVGGYKLPTPNYAIWTFNAIFDLSEGWQAFGLRASSNTLVAWGATSYLVIVKEDVIELHRFYNGGKMWDTVPNTFIKTGQKHLIEVGSLDVKGGVQLIFKVDGKTVFDVLDSEGYIQSEGYFTIYSVSGKKLELSEAGIE